MAQKLLLIDENSRLLTLVGDYLSNLGYEVHRASESDEAAALLKNYQYSIVITGTDWEDFGAPGGNLVQTLKGLAYCPKIVRLEESGSKSGASPALKDDTTMVVEKPIGLLRLGDLMHELTNVWPQAESIP